MQALLRWRRSAHTLHSFPAPSTCFFGTINNFAFQRLPLLSAGIMVPFSSHFLICFSTILATSGENLFGGMKTGVALPVQISVSPSSRLGTICSMAPPSQTTELSSPDEI